MGGDTVKLWNVSTGDLLKTIVGRKKNVNSCNFSPCGKFIVYGFSYKIIYLWEILS